MSAQSYTELRPEPICETLTLLARRIEERFPGSGLSRVANELVVIADEDQRALENLARYLDYCSELLALTSKLAALHAQHLQDPVVLDAVNDIETLTSDLSRKIWQKITILDIANPQFAVPQPTPPGHTT